VGSVSVLFGNGDGTYQKPKGYSMAGPVVLGTADFNGDRTSILSLPILPATSACCRCCWARVTEPLKRRHRRR
jgi:hypothetical protein